MAKLDGEDPWELLFDRQAQGIDDCWSLLMQTPERWRIDRVVALAEELLLPLLPATQHLASDDLNPSPDLNLLFIIQDLDDFPETGWSLLEAGLCNRLLGCRQITLRILEQWGPETWPDEIWEALSKQEPRESEANLRTRMRLVLGLPT